jgi:hypothetical protein
MDISQWLARIWLCCVLAGLIWAAIYFGNPVAVAILIVVGIFATVFAMAEVFG